MESRPRSQTAQLRFARLVGTYLHAVEAPRPKAAPIPEGVRDKNRFQTQIAFFQGKSRQDSEEFDEDPRAKSQSSPVIGSAGVDNAQFAGYKDQNLESEVTFRQVTEDGAVQTDREQEVVQTRRRATTLKAIAQADLSDNDERGSREPSDQGGDQQDQRAQSVSLMAKPNNESVRRSESDPSTEVKPTTIDLNQAPKFEYIIRQRGGTNKRGRPIILLDDEEMEVKYVLTDDVNDEIKQDMKDHVKFVIVDEVKNEVKYVLLDEVNDEAKDEVKYILLDDTKDKTEISGEVHESEKMREEENGLNDEVSNEAKANNINDAASHTVSWPDDFELVATRSRAAMVQSVSEPRKPAMRSPRSTAFAVPEVESDELTSVIDSVITLPSRKTLIGSQSPLVAQPAAPPDDVEVVPIIKTRNTIVDRLRNESPVAPPPKSDAFVLRVLFQLDNGDVSSSVMQVSRDLTVNELAEKIAFKRRIYEASAMSSEAHKVPVVVQQATKQAQSKQIQAKDGPKNQKEQRVKPSLRERVLGMSPKAPIIQRPEPGAAKLKQKLSSANEPTDDPPNQDSDEDDEPDDAQEGVREGEMVPRKSFWSYVKQPRDAENQVLDLWLRKGPTDGQWLQRDKLLKDYDLGTREMTHLGSVNGSDSGVGSGRATVSTTSRWASLGRLTRTQTHTSSVSPTRSTTPKSESTEVVVPVVVYARKTLRLLVSVAEGVHHDVFFTSQTLPLTVDSHNTAAQVVALVGSKIGLQGSSCRHFHLQYPAPSCQWLPPNLSLFESVAFNEEDAVCVSFRVRFLLEGTSTLLHSDSKAFALVFSQAVEMVTGGHFYCPVTHAAVLGALLLFTTCGEYTHFASKAVEKNERRNNALALLYRKAVPQVIAPRYWRSDQSLAGMARNLHNAHQALQSVSTSTVMLAYLDLIGFGTLPPSNKPHQHAAVATQLQHTDDKTKTQNESVSVSATVMEELNHSQSSMAPEQLASVSEADEAAAERGTNVAGAVASRNQSLPISLGIQGSLPASASAISQLNNHLLHSGVSSLGTNSSSTVHSSLGLNGKQGASQASSFMSLPREESYIAGLAGSLGTSASSVSSLALGSDSFLVADEDEEAGDYGNGQFSQDLLATGPLSSVTALTDSDHATFLTRPRVWVVQRFLVRTKTSSMPLGRSINQVAELDASQDALFLLKPVKTREVQRGIVAGVIDKVEAPLLHPRLARLHLHDQGVLQMLFESYNERQKFLAGLHLLIKDYANRLGDQAPPTPTTPGSGTTTLSMAIAWRLILQERNLDTSSPSEQQPLTGVIRKNKTTFIPPKKNSNKKTTSRLLGRITVAPTSSVDKEADKSINLGGHAWWTMGGEGHMAGEQPLSTLLSQALANTRDVHSGLPSSGIESREQLQEARAPEVKPKDRGDELGLNVFCGTFNLGKHRPEALAWIPLGRDIYALGFQECNFKAKRPHADCEAEMSWLVASRLGDAFVSLVAHSMWEIRIIIFVRKSLLPFVTNLHVDYVATGVAGLGKNKGGVGVSFSVLETSMCFFNLHLAARPSQKRNIERMRNTVEVLRSCKLGRVVGDPFNSYHITFVLGDMNYRVVGIPRPDILDHIKKREWKELGQCDQLTRAVVRGETLYGSEEQPIIWPPTYRYDPESDQWSDKKLFNLPSYTDRVRWKAAPGVVCLPLHYNSVMGVFGSDHRPVVSTFHVKAWWPLTAPRVVGYGAQPVPGFYPHVVVRIYGLLIDLYVPTHRARLYNNANTANNNNNNPGDTGPGNGEKEKEGIIDDKNKETGRERQTMIQNVPTRQPFGPRHVLLRSPALGTSRPVHGDFFASNHNRSNGESPVVPVVPVPEGYLPVGRFVADDVITLSLGNMYPEAVEREYLTLHVYLQGVNP